MKANKLAYEFSKLNHAVQCAYAALPKPILLLIQNLNT